METYRTPDDRFSALADLPGGLTWRPHYAEVADPDGGTVRMSYVDVRPAEGWREGGTTVVLLHGEPTWSYLYRHTVAELVAAGLRCVAPDLVGFGRSDKPLEVADHSYARHVAWVRELLVEHLGLSGATLVGQDWGGLIGLRLATEAPGLFGRLVAANTGLPTGDHDMPAVWWEFRRAVEKASELDVGRLVASGCAQGLDEEVRAAYDAPFPTEESKAGPRAMPGLVPTRPDDPATVANRTAWAALGSWNAPFLTAFGDADPITGAMAPVLRRHVPGAAGREHPEIAGAGHFLQEDAGAALGRAVADFVRGTPLA